MAVIDEGKSESFFGETRAEKLSREFSDIQPLDSHGICRIYKAQRHGKWFVLKCLKPEYAATASMRELLHKEFAIGFRLEHPNVMHTYDIEEVPGLGECIVSEWIDGTPLSDLISSRSIKPQQAVDLCRDIADGVDYLHSMQILHLDLKASNIMVTRIGSKPKIIDFGMSDASDYAVFKSVGGTKDYMAPETVAGSTDLDGRADIYALGVVIDKINRSLPSPKRSLKRIAAKCMCQDPSKRYASASDIRWPGKRRTLYWLPVVAAALLAASVVIALLPSRAGSAQHITDTLTQVIEVHDTVVVAPAVDTARVEFLGSLETVIRRIASEEWEREFTLLIDPATHTPEEVTANYRPFFEAFDAKANERVRKLVDSHIPKDDPDYFKIMSGAIALCQQAVNELYASKPHNKRIMDSMLREEIVP